MDAWDEGGRSYIADLGLEWTVEQDGAQGVLPASPHLAHPGTSMPRASVLAVAADALAGNLAALRALPKLCVTTDLVLHVFAAPVGDIARIQCQPVRRGRTLDIHRVRFADASGTEFAACTIGFTSVPWPVELTAEAVKMHEPVALPAQDLTDLVGARLLGGGRAMVDLVPSNVNGSGGLQGGLTVLLAELAAASVAEIDGPVVVTTIALRYLRPIRGGPAVATATCAGRMGGASLVWAEVRDAAAPDVVAAVADVRCELAAVALTQ